MYVTVKLNLTEAKAKKLLQGQTVKLAKDDILDDSAPMGVPTALTATQAKRMHKAVSCGKGLTLKMSQAQARYHGVKGSGFWGNLWGKIKGAAKSVYKNVVKPVGKAALQIPGVKQAVQQGVSRIGSAVSGLTGVPTIGQAAQNIANRVVDSVGSGMKKVNKGGRPPCGTGRIPNIQPVAVGHASVPKQSVPSGVNAPSGSGKSARGAGKIPNLFPRERKAKSGLMGLGVKGRGISSLTGGSFATPR